MSRSLTRWQAIVLGLIVLLGGALAAAGLVAVGSRQWFWSQVFHVRAGFDSIRGVEIGTRVRIQGIDAGEVVALEPPSKAGGQVMLRLRLKEQFRPLVRQNATVTIVSEGMLGGKVLEIDPGSNDQPPAADNALLASRPSKELGDVLGQVGATLDGIVDGQGTLGKLAKDPQAYEELVRLMQQGHVTLESIQRGADGLKNVPFVGRGILNPREVLDRPSQERNRKWFAEKDLFEPGRSVLTTQGQERLQALKDWLEGLTRHEGAEVVVVAYADPQNQESQHAKTLTQDQAQKVGEVLARVAPVWGGWKSRAVTTLGMGTTRSPVVERELLPPARVEILVFVPQR